MRTSAVSRPTRGQRSHQVDDVYCFEGSLVVHHQQFKNQSRDCFGFSEFLYVTLRFSMGVLQLSNHFASMVNQLDTTLG